MNSELNIIHESRFLYTAFFRSNSSMICLTRAFQRFLIVNSWTYCAIRIFVLKVSTVISPKFILSGIGPWTKNKNTNSWY